MVKDQIVRPIKSQATDPFKWAYLVGVEHA